MPAKKVSSRLVIDASVARAAGDKDAKHEKSKSCRDFLRQVMAISYQIVMTPELKAEWDKHKSVFAQRWLASMVAKKKLAYYGEIPQQEELWQKIVMAIDGEKDRKAMEKDFLLLTAALATDKTVISLDEKVRKMFDQAAEQVGELTAIVWVNPTQETEQAIDWLENGAKPDKERRLGFRE
ncbi:MAG TPA: hypothetical protein IGS52_02180 [Oscillatoriaceae cyanobacterium M33_DOE_052]|uniref:PIN domain-containing protein n=1 Tax=Planktothricoides sp. SpSt-374 TaxID=2282167 RepID=A0A7C3ZLE4_9CYAN|nr:hypothetical protein [Oscillatoriaceae cyanobacterium M33_DOE_052]